MVGFNPWIDTAIICALMAICALGWYAEVKWNKRKQSQLRGATRVA
ncbi:hypothetical protein PA10_00101 [Pseudomonas phage pPa_SNUABM_DT01]|nr:hypothetical protein PA10_00101 [Pseudomonas phage pPa_SNUABM_DT01]